MHLYAYYSKQAFSSLKVNETFGNHVIGNLQTQGRFEIFQDGTSTFHIDPHLRRRLPVVASEGDNEMMTSFRR